MRPQRWAAPILLAGVLGAAATALQWSGGGSLAAPPLGDPGHWADWLAARDPVVAAFSLVRLVALAALWYVVAATSVGLALRLAGAARLVAAADRVTVGPVRRMLAGISLSLAATTVVTVAGPVAMAVAAQPASTTATSTTATSTTATSTTATSTAVPGATVTMHLLGPADVVPALQAPPTAGPLSPPAQPDGVGSTERWTVQPGQCFWTIAETVLARAWGRAPADAEIVPYWQRIISVNRAALAAPSNPDLIFPGQVFEVPHP